MQRRRCLQGHQIKHHSKMATFAAKKAYCTGLIQIQKALHNVPPSVLTGRAGRTRACMHSVSLAMKKRIVSGPNSRIASDLVERRTNQEPCFRRRTEKRKREESRNREESRKRQYRSEFLDVDGVSYFQTQSSMSRRAQEEHTKEHDATSNQD